MAITPNRVKDAVYARNIFSVTPEINTPYEEVLKPEYWAHAANKFHPTDRIEVLAEDGSWFAELFVVSCGRNWAKVCQMRYVELSESVADEPQAKFIVKWRGQMHKHCVVRVADNEVIKTEFATAPEAKKWMDDYETNVLKA
jgi:hypothetical protein